MLNIILTEVCKICLKMWLTDETSGLGFETTALCHANCHSGPVDKFSLFERYSQTGLQRLGLELSQDINFHVIWKEVEPFAVSCFNFVCI